MKRILFPTDLSLSTVNSLKFILDHALESNAIVNVLYTYTATKSPRRLIMEEGNLRNENYRKLSDFIREHIDNSYWKYMRLDVQEGFSLRHIIDFTKTEKYDLVVMTRSKKYDWFIRTFGSRTSFVATGAHCPVLIVPPNLVDMRDKNILIAHASSEKEDTVIKKVLNQFVKQQGMPENPDPVQKKKRSVFHYILPEKLIPFGYRKLKRKLRNQIFMNDIDMVLIPVFQKHLFNRLLHNHYTLRLALELERPVLVINNNVIQNLRNKKMRRLKLAML